MLLKRDEKNWWRRNFSFLRCYQIIKPDLLIMRLYGKKMMKLNWIKWQNHKRKWFEAMKHITMNESHFLPFHLPSHHPLIASHKPIPKIVHEKFYWITNFCILINSSVKLFRFPRSKVELRVFMNYFRVKKLFPSNIFQEESLPVFYFRMFKCKIGGKSFWFRNFKS